MPEEQRCNLEVATPDGIMQRRVRLGVVAADAGAGPGAKKELDSLEAIVASHKTGTRDSQLQRELASPLQARAAAIHCIALGMTLQQQTHGVEVGLAHSLVQRVVPGADMPAL